MKTVIEMLKGTIFQNPLLWDECFYKGWETADEYLSGNLMHKLSLAEDANEEYPGIFAENIKAYGTYNVDVKVYPEISAKLKVTVSQ